MVMKYPLFFGLVFAISVSASAKDSLFSRIPLNDGLSIEIPAHWMLISEENRKNIRVAGEAIIKNAEIDTGVGKDGIKRLGASGAPVKLIKFSPVRVERINSTPALAFSYIREDVDHMQRPWIVTTYRIPAPRKVIELTLSYSESNTTLSPRGCFGRADKQREYDATNRKIF